jgi:hypothetical protein
MQIVVAQSMNLRSLPRVPSRGRNLAGKPRDISEIDLATLQVGDEWIAPVSGMDTAPTFIADNAFTFQLGAYTEIILIANQSSTLSPILKVTKIIGQQVAFDAAATEVQMSAKAVVRLKMDENSVVNFANTLRRYVQEKISHRIVDLAK